MMESKILKDFFHRQHMKWKHRCDEVSSQNSARIFDENAEEYDQWFDRHPVVFQSELAALKELMPTKGQGLEIGGGTGRFAVPLGVRTVVEPAGAMAALASHRGLEVHRAFAESLPFEKDQFDYALLVTVLCFVTDPLAAMKEVRRVLKKGGLALVAFIDRETALGKSTLGSSSKYFRHAHLFSCQDMMDLLERAGFKVVDSRQTLFSDPSSLLVPEKPKHGFGDGGFVVFAAEALK